MAQHFSRDRVFCADYLQVHKKKILFKRNFRKVEDIGLPALRKLLPKATSHAHDDDQVGQNCFRRLRSMISCSQASSAETSDDFVEEGDEVVNRKQQTSSTCALACKHPPKSHSQSIYIHGKQSDFDFSCTANTEGRRKVCNRHLKTLEAISSVCAQWISNFKEAYQARSSYQE